MTSPDNVWIDLDIINNDRTGGEIKTTLQFKENRSMPIIDDPSSYSMAVARFSMDTPNASLPIFIPLINTQGTPHSPNSRPNIPGFFDPNMNPNLTPYYVTFALLNSVTRTITNYISTPVRWFPEDASAAPPNNGISNLYAGGFPSVRFPSGTPGRGDGVVGVSPRMNRTQLGPVSQPPWSPPPNSFNFNALNSDLPTTGIQYNNIIYTDGSTLDSIDNFLLTFTLDYFQIGDVSDFIPGFPPGTDCFVLPDMPDFISFPCASTISATQILTPSAGLIAEQTAILTGPITISGKPDFTFKTSNFGDFDDWLYIIRSPTLVNYTHGVWSSPAGPSLPWDPYYNLTFKFNQTFGYKITASSGNIVDGLTYGTFQTDTLINYNLPSNGQADNGFSIWRWLYNDNDPAGNNMLLPKITIYKPFLSSQDITTGYYNCYTPQWWLGCVNQTIADAWDAARIGETTTAPFIVLDSGMPKLMTPIITLTGGQQVGFACLPNQVTGNGIQPIYLNGLSNPIQARYCLFMNEPLYNLFSSFNGVYYGSDFVSINTALLNASPFPSPFVAERASYFPDLFNYYIQPVIYDSADVTYVSPTLSYVATRSEYSPIPMWLPIQSIQFTSSLACVMPSFTNVEIPFNVSNASTLPRTCLENNQVSNKITDIQVALTTGFEYKPTISYTPRGEYRFIQLLGNLPLYLIDFSISWITKYGQVVPFRLGAQCSSSLKLLFQRKRVNLRNIEPYN